MMYQKDVLLSKPESCISTCLEWCWRGDPIRTAKSGFARVGGLLWSCWTQGHLQVCINSV